MGRKTVKLDEETFEKHNPRRKSLGMTWNEYVDEEAPELASEVDYDRVRKIFREEIERATHS